MAKEHSFDITAKADMQEIKNAIMQAQKEADNRYDFKGLVKDGHEFQREQAGGPDRYIGRKDNQTGPLTQDSERERKGGCQRRNQKGPFGNSGCDRQG